MDLYHLFDFDMESPVYLSLCGAGGKTTLLYALCREAALSGEYALLDAEAVLAETEAFRAEMRKEELEPEGFPGLVIARCPDGDRVLLDPAGRVCRISHEAPEVCGEWSSLPRFIAEALEEDDLS